MFNTLTYLIILKLRVMTTKLNALFHYESACESVMFKVIKNIDLIILHPYGIILYIGSSIIDIIALSE